MEYGKLVKCLSKFVAGIVSAAIVFTLVPKILGTDTVNAASLYGHLWVGGTVVTSDNANSIDAVKGGTATYDDSTNTLTLTEVTGFESYYETEEYNIPIYIYLDKNVSDTLNICLEGENDINSRISGYLIYSEKADINICGTGSLSVRDSGSYKLDNGIVTYGDLTVNADLDIKTELGCLIGEESLTINSNVKAYSTQTCSIRGKKITINGGSLDLQTEMVSWGYGTIIADDSLTISDSLEIITPENGVVSSKSGYQTVTDGTDEAYHVVIEPKTVNYDLWIGNVQVTSKNCDNVLGEEKDGNPTVSFDPDTSTLTFNDPDIATPYPITSSLESLLYLGSSYSFTELIIKGSAELENDDAIALWSNNTSVTVVLDADIKSTLDFYLASNSKLIIEGGNISFGYFEVGKFEMKDGCLSAGRISTTGFVLSGGEITAECLEAQYSFTMDGGLLIVNNTDASQMDGAGIRGDYHLDTMEINGGTVLAEGVNYGIYFADYSGTGDLEINGGNVTAKASGEAAMYIKGSLAVTGGNVTAENTGKYGIYSKNKVDISGGVVYSSGRYYGIYADSDITISDNSTRVDARVTDEADSFTIVSKNGDIVLNDSLEVVKPYAGIIAPYTGSTDAYKFNDIVYGKTLDVIPNDVTIMDPANDSCLITWKAGAGDGNDIIEYLTPADIQTKSFPSEWTAPAGMHFYGWNAVDAAHGSLYRPDVTFHLLSDTYMTAVYDYCLTGWEDTGADGVDTGFGVCGDAAIVSQTGAEVFIKEGDIDIYLKEGYELVDNKVEVISVNSGTVVDTLTMTKDSTGKRFYCTGFALPGEDVTLRFATKKIEAGSGSSSSSSSSSSSTTTTTTTSSTTTTTTSTVTAANTYTVVKGADGEWDGKSDYVIEVKSSSDDEHCIDRFLWAAVDGHELVVGKECLITKGSTIVTIKSDYLKSLGEGTHNVVVNFKDNSVATTLVVKAAGTQSAASVPATGEGLAPTLFIGGTFVIAAAGFIGIAIMKKRKEF